MNYQKPVKKPAKKPVKPSKPMPKPSRGGRMATNMNKFA